MPAEGRSRPAKGLPAGEVLERAAALGRTIRDTAAFGRLRAAEKAVMASPDSVKLAEALSTLQHRKAAAEGTGGSLSADDAGRLDTVAAAAAADPVLRELWEAQQGFQKLVDEVRARMLAELKPGK